MNRSPRVDAKVSLRAYNIPKSEWTEMYFDLYRQCFGETCTDEEIMAEAEKRRKILKQARNLK